MRGNAYSAVGNVTAGAQKTAVHLIPATTAPIFIYRVMVGCAQTPAAQAARWELHRTSADGTGTTVTPVQVNGNGVTLGTSRVGATVGHSVEPTYVAMQPGLSLPLNQQATLDWQANPGKEFEVTGGTAGGVGLKMVTSTGTTVHAVQLMWEE